MYTDVSFGEFCDAFERSQYKDNFSYNGKRALFDYLEEYEESTGEKIELDIVALCCDFTEYDSLIDCARNYSCDSVIDNLIILRDTEEIEKKARKFLEDRTTLIEFDGGVIIQNF